MLENNPAIHVGTSGWHYDHWQGPFYPEDMASDAFLGYYARRLGTVEVNNSFYQLPDEETLLGWRETVAEDFVFAVKASRYITHMKKLKDPEEPVANFMGRIEALGDRLGPILFQLPPHWRLNLDRLRAFLDVLPAGERYAFEFRHPSWLEPQVYAALEERGAAFCLFDFHDWHAPRQVTADFVYVRLHGPEGTYQGYYDTPTLAGWAGAFSSWQRQGKEVFCYFNNDQAGYAVRNAQELSRMLGRDT